MTRIALVREKEEPRSYTGYDLYCVLRRTRTEPTAITLEEVADMIVLAFRAEECDALANLLTTKHR